MIVVRQRKLEEIFRIFEFFSPVSWIVKHTTWLCDDLYHRDVTVVSLYYLLSSPSISDRRTHTLYFSLSLNCCCFVSLTPRSISLQLSQAISVPLSLIFLYLYAPSHIDPILILFLFFNYLLLSLPFLTLSTISKVASFSKSSFTTFMLPLLAALCKAVQPF